MTEDDLARERKVEAIVRENLARWQDEGLVPDMPIEPGEKTDEPIRTRGWTYWHHLFGARQLLIIALMRNRRLVRTPTALLAFANDSERFYASLCRIQLNAAQSWGREMC